MRPAGRRRRRRLALGLVAALLLVVLAVVLVLASPRGTDETPEPQPPTGADETPQTPPPGTDDQPEPAPPPPSDPGRVLWGSDFEDGDLSVYRNDVLTDGSGNEGFHEITTEQARTGRRAVKLVLPPSTSGGTIGRYQLVADMPDGSEGDELWYGISMYLGDDWSLGQIVQNRQLFLGTFGFRYTEVDDNGPGTGNIGARDVNGLAVHKTEVNGYPAGDTTLGPVVTGQWVDWVVHIRWSRGGDGLREIWRDGRQLTRYEGPTLNLTSSFEHRMGLYQGTEVDQTRTVYWDNHRVGTSYTAVDPSR